MLFIKLRVAYSKLKLNWKALEKNSIFKAVMPKS